MKNPDMLITSDMKILQQVLASALQKSGASVSIFMINQVNITGEGVKQTLKAEGRPKTLVDKETMAKALHDVGWSKSKAAKKLGLSLNTVQVNAKKWGLSPPSGKWPDHRRHDWKQLQLKSGDEK